MDVANPEANKNKECLVPCLDLIDAPTTWNEFADIYADHGDCAVEALGHGVLLCLWSPLPDSSLAGGRSTAGPSH